MEPSSIQIGAVEAAVEHSEAVWAPVVDVSADTASPYVYRVRCGGVTFGALCGGCIDAYRRFEVLRVVAPAGETFGVEVYLRHRPE